MDLSWALCQMETSSTSVLRAPTRTRQGNVRASQGTWSFVGGTGKLKGIKGKGTYKGKPDPEGNLIFDIEGEYELPK